MGRAHKHPRGWMKPGWGARKLCLWDQISHPAEGAGKKELRERGHAALTGVSVAKGGGYHWVEKDGGSVVRVLTPFHCREGRRGSIQVDGEELVSGQSPGPNVAVNTKGSIYVGKS